MAAEEPQLVDQQEFIDILDYQFKGDDSTVGKKRAFVEAYREEGSIYHAAIVARIHRATYYNWINSDPAFQQAVEDSKEDCYDQVETSVFKKAVNGDTISSIFYLKAHRPKFRDKLQIDVQSVQDEINERLQQLGLLQLPPMSTTGMIDAGYSSGDAQVFHTSSTAIRDATPHPSSQDQKE